MKIRAAITALALALAVIGGVVLSSNRSQTSALQGATAAAPGATDARTARKRIVVVTRGHEPSPSAPGRILHALRVAGKVPRSPTTATVISDKKCAPDARGISHCTNALRLRNGRLLTVRHPHRMTEVPCLEPGERVEVRSA